MSQVIIYPNTNGGVAVVTPVLSEGETVQDIAAKVVPTGVSSQIINKSEIPTDRTLRAAWEYGVSAVEVNVTKAKDLAHTVRRTARAKEFAPYDDIIAKQIPGADATEAEAQRVLIRSKYDTKQTEIDDCTTPEAITTIVKGMIS